MLHVGVTGGIGSGKTTFLSVWERLGVTVVYADDLAKELMETDSALKAEIILAFGPDSYLPDGKRNRAFLAREAFDKGNIGMLNNIVHPFVYRELENRRKKAKEVGALLFAHESALLLHSGKPDVCDVVILIECPVDTRIRRVTDRDRTEPENVENRMKQQPDFENVKDLADIVINNDGSVQKLERKAEELYRQLLQQTAESGQQ